MRRFILVLVAVTTTALSIGVVKADPPQAFAAPVPGATVTAAPAPNPQFYNGNWWYRMAVILMGGTALAIDQPPQDSQQQRAWLVGHLVTDMEALGTFDGNTLAKVPAIVNNLTDDQVALLAQYYFLTRSKTEQDASLYAMQQQGSTDEQVNEAKAQIADLLTAMNDQIMACYDQFASMPQPVPYLAQICYASVPGWCCHARCFVPDWYYDNGCFVGPCYNAACSGSWAVPVCNAYHDHGSHFYSGYYNVANTVHIKRSTNLAHRQADWLRNHGDWHNTLAHDRLLHQPQYNSPTRLPVSTQNHVANRSSGVRSPHVPLAYANRALAGNRTPVAHQQKTPYRASAPRQHQAAMSHVTHAAVPHPAKVRQQAPKPNATALHAYAARPAAHAARPAAHASHPRSVPHAQAHASSGGHSKHR